MQQSKVVALVKDRKETAKRALTDAYHAFQKGDLFRGVLRTYRPRQEDEPERPQESKTMQTTVRDQIDRMRRSVVRAIDTVRTQDEGNLLAAGSVDVDDGVFILPNVPATHLLFLEKTLEDIRTFVVAMPVLDPSEKWALDGAVDVYRSPSHESLSTRKVQKPLVLYPATPEHPAQTQLISEDIPVGTWETVHFSGAISADEKRDILSRLTKLQEAVKLAREDANRVEVTWREEGEKILDYIFHGG